MVAGNGRHPDRPDRVDGRRSQLLKGVLDMCLLAVIAEEPSYGYEMVRKLRDRGLVLGSEGSIYPLLSRLQKQGYVDGYLVSSSEGPARKYYRIADAGREVLRSWMTEWRALAQGVDAVIAAAAEAQSSGARGGTR